MMANYTPKNEESTWSAKSVLRKLFRFLRPVLLIYIGLLLFLAGCQRRLIYQPSHASGPSLRQKAARVGMAPWENTESDLIGWKSLPDPSGTPPDNRLVIFHGNAGFALHRTYFRDGFSGVGDGTVWELFILEYPGYGARPGSPGEENFYAAGERALRHLWQADDRPVYLLGESIGSGVACHLAAEFPDRIAGLILISPFTSLPDVAAHHYPIFPTRWILRDRYDNAEALKNYGGALAVLLAGNDQIVPPKFGRKLYKEYRGPKKLWVQENAGHNSIDYSPTGSWWRELSQFLIKADQADNTDLNFPGNSHFAANFQVTFVEKHGEQVD
jgi:pimeloyl-ACP methyl ester carboxylesterase